MKGVWRQIGRQGVLKAHGYEDTNMTERTEEHSGTGPFAEQGLATKKQVLQSVFADADEQRRKHAVAAGPAAQAPAEIMATLQQLLPGLRQAQGSEAAPSESEAVAAPVQVPDEEEEEAEEEEVVCPAQQKQRRPVPRPVLRLVLRPMLRLPVVRPGSESARQACSRRLGRPTHENGSEHECEVGGIASAGVGQ